VTLLRLTYIFLFSTAQYYIQLSRTKIDTISTNTDHLQDYNITTVSLKLVKYKHVEMYTSFAWKNHKILQVIF